MIFDEIVIQEAIKQFLCILSRVSGFMMIAPIFGASSIPALIKMTLTLWISIFCYMDPLIQTTLESHSLSLFSLETYFLIIIELTIGLLIGFVWKMVFEVFVMAGQIISMQMGMSFAVINDPGSDNGAPVLASFLNISTYLLFLIMNGPLWMLDFLKKSFSLFQVQNFRGIDIDYPGLLSMISALFAYGLSFSFVILSSLLVMNIAFGLMGRMAPQLNIIQLGVPVFILVGFAVLYASIDSILPFLQMCQDQFLGLLEHV